MSSLPQTRDWIALMPVVVVNAVALAAVLVCAWANGGPSAAETCDVYCGPAPNMVVALGLLALAFVLVPVVLVFDAVAVLTLLRRRRVDAAAERADSDGTFASTRAADETDGRRHDGAGQEGTAHRSTSGPS